MKRKSVFLLVCMACMLLASCIAPEKRVWTNTVVNYNAKKRKIIVFIHGYGGDKMSTWTNDKGTNWLKLIENDKDFSDYVVCSVNYPDGKDETWIDLKDQGLWLNRELESMDIVSNGRGAYEEVIFVAHSLGNLSLRSALYQNPSLYKYVKIPLIVSLASPSEGTKLADIAKIFTDKKIFDDLTAKNSENYRKKINQEWEKNKGNTQIRCYYETKKIKAATKVVGRGSASSVCTSAAPANTDHIGIAKPSGYDDKIYKWVKEDIKNTEELLKAFYVKGDEFVNIYDQ